MPSTKLATLGSIVVLPAAPMPRMLILMKEDWTPLLAWKLVATRPRSWMVTMFDRCRAGPEKAAIEIGTSWMFSTRFWAVTVIAPSSAFAAAVSVPVVAGAD